MIKITGQFLLILIMIFLFLPESKIKSESKKNDMPILQYDYKFKQDSLIMNNNKLWELENTSYPFSFDSYVRTFGNVYNICYDIEKKYRDAKLVFKLSMGSEDFKWGNNIFDCTVEGIFVYVYDEFSSIGSFSVDMHLESDGSTTIIPDELNYVDISSYLNAGAVEFIIYDIANYSVTSGFENSISLEMFLVYEQCFMPRKVSSTDPFFEIISPKRVDLSTTGNNGLVTFNWETNQNCELKYHNYQLQILKLYDIDSDPNVYKSKIDWSKAFTFETGNSNTSTALSIVEGTGFYVWRVRPISNFFKGGIANDRNWGDWSSTVCGEMNFSDGDIVEIDIGDNDTYCCGFYYRQFDENINWKYVRNFAEGEKGTSVMETMQYADNLLKIRQEQTYIATDDTKLIKQNLYDFVGRNALTTLPVPVEVGPFIPEAHLGFYKNLVLDNSTGDLYSADNFDFSSTIIDNFKNPNPIKASSNSYPFRYYAGNNFLDSHVPSSGKLPYSNYYYYPFVRNLYDQDGTGRIKEQSGFGGNHKIGSDNTVKTMYSSVTDDELIPIFGSEAPNSKQVHKIINIDQNGVVNYTYQLSNGKILATCLNMTQINDPSPLYDLEYNLDETLVNSANKINDPYLSKTVNPELTGENEIGENGFLVTELHSFAVPTEVNFNYTLNPKKVVLTDIFCIPYCPTCDYYVVLNIRDKETGIEKYTTNGEITNSSEDCNTPVPLYLGINQTLEPGSYIFERYIYVKKKIPGTDQNYVDIYKEELEEKILDPLSPFMIMVQTEIFDKLKLIIDGTIKLEEFYEDLDELVATIGSNWSYNATDKIYSYENGEFCCGTITIPKYICLECENYPTSTDDNGNIDFEKYLLDKFTTPPPPMNLNELFFDYGGSVLYTDFPPFYPDGRGAFNQLIENMLAEEESCYSPCKLWNCWKYIVDNFELLCYYENKITKVKTLNKDVNLLDMFLSCTGKMLVGPSTSNLPYEDDYGYLVNAHKYFKQCTGPYCAKCEELLESQFGEIDLWTQDICGESQDENFQDKKWEAYYKCIRSLGITPQNDYDPDDNVPEDLKNALATGDIEEFLDNVKSVCDTNCDKKLFSYINIIIKEYNKNFKSVQGQKYTFVDSNIVVLDESEYDKESAHHITFQTVLCQATALVIKCKELCVGVNYDPGPPPIIDYEAAVEQFKKSLFGWLDIKIKNPNCPLGYESADSWSTVTFDDKAKAIVAYLNKFLKEEILDELNKDGRPYRDTCRIFENYIKLSKAYTLLLGTKPCFAWLDSCGTGSGGDSTVVFCDSLPNGFKAHYYDPDDSTFYEDFCFRCDEYKKYVKDSTVTNVKISGADRFFQKSTIDLLFNQGIMPNNTSNPISLYGNSFSYPASSARFLSNWIYAFYPGIDYEFVYHNGKILLKNTYHLNDSTEFTYYFQFCCIDSTQIFGCDSSICYKWIDELPEVDIDFTVKMITCDMKNAVKIETDVYQQLQSCIDTKKHEIEIEYNTKCLENIDHHTYLSFDINYYHYTLYYYDRAGNLVRTVPPKGVDINPSRDRLSTDPFPAHTYGTSYIYNSIGQLDSTHNPDYNQLNGGSHTGLYYDLKQQLRFSQEPNQRQKIYPTAGPIYDYSYTHYDELGRVIESGEFSPYVNAAQPIPLLHNLPEFIVKYPQTNAYPPNKWKKMVVKTFYSRPAVILPEPYNIDVTQHNLDNRVSFTFRDEDGQPETFWDQAFTYYSYDAHGNVEWVIHKLPFNIVTKVDYEYDLISGNVKRVDHNKNRLNEFFYQYRYDADNRLSEVYTSRHGELWDKDALYKYYKHGPLKRIEIGEDKIQGIDYAYTINGWLKAINGSNIALPNPDLTDMGRDGYTGTGYKPNPLFAYDEFGQLLSYFDNDYFCDFSVINRQPVPPPMGNGNMNLNLISYNASKGLFNGNITASEFSFGPRGNTLLGFITSQKNKYGYLYQYDVLGRLKEAGFHFMSGLGAVPFNVWNVYADSAYSAFYRYDPNGNMKNLRRLGKPGNSKVLDGLLYNYKMINSYPSNRLETLIDAGTQTDVLALKNVSHPYTYDHSGNLQTDDESDIQLIEWTPDGKVKYIKKTGENIHFIYDARGDLVCKANLGKQYDYYLRDANGEILEIITMKLPVSTYPGLDPWEIVPGHPYYPPPPPSPPGIQMNAEAGGKKESDLPDLMSVPCPGQPWSSIDSVSANWACWDTTSLDIILISLGNGMYGYGVNPFLNNNIHNTYTPEFIALAKNEWYIYGSEGHGRFARAFPHDDDRWGYSNAILSELFTENRYLKQKQYELKDHLGNVRVVLSDLKIPVNAIDTLPPFKADVLAAYSHYPFGMLQPSMYSEAGTTYRFGFNGMLRNDEVMDIGSTPPQEEGLGNNYYTYYRLFDPRTTRWFFLDPLRAQFPWSSPYVGMGNNPVSLVDPFGDSTFIFNNDLTYKTSEDDGNENWSITVLHEIKDEKNGTTIERQVFQLNDPIGDPERMKSLISEYGSSKQFLFYESEKDENGYMNSIGLKGWDTDRYYKTKFIFANWLLLNNSHYNPVTNEGVLDFWGSVIVEQILRPNNLELSNDRSAFFITGRKAYNDMDYGNRLWGKATGIMKLPLWWVKTGAHIDNMYNHDFQLDNIFDQKAIEDGWRSVK